MPRIPKKVICSDTSKSKKECKCYRCATLNTKVCTTCNMPRFILSGSMCFKCTNPEWFNIDS